MIRVHRRSNLGEVHSLRINGSGTKLIRFRLAMNRRMIKGRRVGVRRNLHTLEESLRTPFETRQREVMKWV